MANNDEAIHAQLRELRKPFIAGLPVRQASIDGFWQLLSDEHWDWQVMTELHRAAHNLAGASGTFGLSDVSATARALENLCKAWLDAKTVPCGGNRAQLQENMNALRQAIATAMKNQT